MAAPVYHVYQCGRYDVETIDGFDSPQFVFVEAACPDLSCANEIPYSQGNESRIAAGRLEHAKLRGIDLRQVQKRVGFVLNELDLMETSSQLSFLGFAPPQALELFLAVDENRESVIDDKFQFSRARTLLSYMHRFGTKQSERAFWDFSLREFSKIMDRAHHRVRALAVMLEAARGATSSTDSESPDDSEPDYEPDFGGSMVDLLRLSGKAGQDLLLQPWSGDLNDQANFLVSRTMQQLARPSFEMLRQTPVEPIDPLEAVEAWLPQVEDVEATDVWAKTMEDLKSAKTAASRRNAIKDNQPPKRLINRPSKINTYSWTLSRSTRKPVRQAVRGSP